MLQAFQATYNTSATQVVSVTTAPSQGQQLGPNIGLRIRADGPCFFTLSTSSGVQCTVPTSGTPTGAQGVVAGAETFNAMPFGWISFATTSGTATAYHTNGFGV